MIMKHRIVVPVLLVSFGVAGVYALVSHDTAAVATVAAAPAGAQQVNEVLSAATGRPPAALIAANATLANPQASEEFTRFEPGVKYMPLSEQPLPAEWKDHLRAQLKNLRETGSLSGGKVTHEFRSVGSMSENLQKKGLKTLLAQLAIEPTDLGAILGPSYVLVGADSQGKWVEKRGAQGFFQIVRNVSGNQMVELSERQLDVLGGDGTVMAVESENARVAGFPATLERLVDDYGATLHNIQWAAKDRMFHLTTKNMEADEVQKLATAITQRSMALPHDGWRQPYEYDPENPLHRIARPDPKDKGRW